MKRRIDTNALYRSLLRTCFKVEALGDKCTKLGISNLGLEQAAEELRHAAEKVAAASTAYKLRVGLSAKQLDAAEPRS